MSAATADLTILADYRPVNNGTLNVAVGRTLTLKNTLATINNTTTGGINGAGTVRIIGAAQKISDIFGGVTLVLDGGSLSGNPPLRMSADSGATITAIVTNNGSLNVTGNGQRIHLGQAAIFGSTNRIIVDGGSIIVNGSGTATANGIFVGSGSDTIGILDINNGTVDLSARNGANAISLFRIGSDSGSRGTVNLNQNGILRVPRLERINGYGVFNFNGGYLELTTARDDYFSLMDEINILDGGAIIDTGSRITSIAAPISGSGALTKLGTGSLNLLGAGSYTGATVVSNGSFGVTLPMASSSLTAQSNVSLSITLGAVSNASWNVSSITLVGSNSLTFNYGASSQPSATLLATPSLNAVGTNVINITGLSWPAGTYRLIDYDGIINGGGNFVVGSIPVGLNAQITNNAATSSIDLIISSGVSTLDWYGFTAFGPSGGGLWDVATTANWNGGASIYNEYDTGTNRIGDNVRFTSGYGFVEIPGTVRPTSINIVNTSTLSISGAGKISGPTSLIKDGSSSLTLGTVNDYTGGTFLRVNNLILATNDALPTAGVLYLGSPNNGAQFLLGGFNQTLAGLVATGSGNGNRRVANNSLTPSVLTFNVPAGQTNVYSHTMGNPALAVTDIANNFSVVKTGPGVQTIGNAGFGGTILISQGTLLLNGVATNVGAITVQSGGAVGGNGTGANVVGSTVTVQAGGRLEPGNLGIGTFTVSNTISLAGESLFQISRTNAQNADELVANSISLGGTLVVTNVGEPLQAGDTFALLAGSMSGSFSSIVLPALDSGMTWNTNNLYSTGTISIDAPPQPVFASISISGNDFVFSGTGGAANGTYYVLTSTNVASPVNEWMPVSTNTFDASGAFNFTTAISAGGPQQFYILQTP
jgi:autotransporter-associated beta strand protein